MQTSMSAFRLFPPQVAQATVRDGGASYVLTYLGASRKFDNGIAVFTYNIRINSTVHPSLS